MRFFTLLLLSFTVQAQSLETLLAERLKTERAISDSEQQWQIEQHNLERTILLYQKEHQLLQLAMQKRQAERDEVSSKREQLLQQQQQQEQQSAQYLALLSTAKQQLAPLWASFPPPLAQQLARPYLELNNSTLSVSQQVSALATLLKEIKRFDSKVHFHLGELPERGWQSEQLYLGMAQGFYRLPDGSETGVGLPTKNGWQWRATPELSQQINAVFALYLQQQKPQLLDLPIREITP